MKRTWTFGQKIAAGFALVVAMTFLMGFVGLYALRAVVDGKDQIILKTGKDLIDAERMRGAMQRELAGLRGYLLTGDSRYIEASREANIEFNQAIERIHQRAPSRELLDRIASITAAELLHQNEVNDLLERRTPTNALDLVNTYEQRATPKFEALSALVRDFVVDMEAAREEQRERASEGADRATTVLIAVALSIFVFSTLAAILLTRALNLQIGTSVQHIRSSAAELQAAATQQASGSKEQATAMSEITTTIGELLATSRQIARSGQHVAQMASNSAHGARGGEDAVSRAREAVASIRQQVDTIVQHMLDLGRKSQQIGGILEIINELAEQTNILAINATIEAAGAGEAGRRFSVVGDEIRKLADRVGGSTKQIRSLIEEIRAAVNATVMATETGSKTVDSGAERFQDVQDAFTRIGQIVTSTMDAGKEIELSTKQQATAVEQVNVAISNVAQATRETEASSQQTLQTAAQLTTLSDDLDRLVQTRRA